MNKKRIKPGPGQESVWDYPRPPKLEKFTGHLRIVFGGEVIMDSNNAYRVLETSHPPTFYIPESDFKSGVLIPTPGSSFCEFKGTAHYYDLKLGGHIARKVAWGYKNPSPGFKDIANHISVYAHRVDACYVNDEQVQPQEGDFYGGWIYSKVVGPFKGSAGTWGW